MDIKNKLFQLAKPYGVQGINFSGCIKSKTSGFTGAMRRKAHAHNGKGTEWFGWICFLSHDPEKRAWKNGKPTQLFWHEVAHIYRPSYTEKKCDRWAWHKIRDNNRSK